MGAFDMLIPKKDEYREVKTPIDYMGAWWSNYRGNSIGRGIHYIYHICGLHLAEHTVWGWDSGGIVTRSSNKEDVLAKVDWSKGYPYFTFIGDKAEFYQAKQEKLLKIDLNNENECLQNGILKTENTK